MHCLIRRWRMAQAEGYGGGAVNTKYSATVEQALKKAQASPANNNKAPTEYKNLDLSKVVM